MAITISVSALLPASKRYTEVKEWDKGYLVVMADYEGIGITEEYIDLVPILKNLYINPGTFREKQRRDRSQGTRKTHR